MKLLWVIPATQPLPIALRRFLQGQGPVFIKLGQHLSTRSDLLSEEILAQLLTLTDSCDAIGFKQVEAGIQHRLGSKFQPLSTVFEDFCDTPVASASLAQVYRASVVRDGESQPVAVKILKPRIEQQVAKDLLLLKRLASVGSRHNSLANQPVMEIFDNFEQVISGECDLIAEAVRTDKMRHNAEASGAQIRFAHIFAEYSNMAYMTSTWLEALPLSKSAELDRPVEQRRELAEAGVDFCFQQILFDNYFHGDMHPGNVMIDVCR